MTDVFPNNFKANRFPNQLTRRMMIDFVLFFIVKCVIRNDYRNNKLFNAMTGYEDKNINSRKCEYRLST